jgi:polysaccharide export outer membrane protein
VLEDPRENIYLQPGDDVALVHDPQSFTVIGATGRNGVVPFDMGSLTLDQAVAKAGGLLDDRADPAGLFVIRFEEARIARQLPGAHLTSADPGGVPFVYHLNMREPAALFLARRFPVRNKDIVYVSDSPFTDVQKVFNLINLLVTPVVTGATIKAAAP